jgi:hypothetical protein
MKIIYSYEGGGTKGWNAQGFTMSRSVSGRPPATPARRV